MSVVANIILNLGIGNDDAIDEVNSYFVERNGFALVDKEKIGGDKFLETELAIGAFNYLNLDKLIEYLKAIDWKGRYCSESVQLIVKEQHKDRFRIINIWEPD